MSLFLITGLGLSDLTTQARSVIHMMANFHSCARHVWSGWDASWRLCRIWHILAQRSGPWPGPGNATVFLVKKWTSRGCVVNVIRRVPSFRLSNTQLLLSTYRVVHCIERSLKTPVHVVFQVFDDYCQRLERLTRLEFVIAKISSSNLLILNLSDCAHMHQKTLSHSHIWLIPSVSVASLSGRYTKPLIGARRWMIPDIACYPL